MLRLTTTTLIAGLTLLAGISRSIADESAVARGNDVAPFGSESPSGYSSPVPDGATVLQSGFGGLMVVVPVSKDRVLAFGKDGWNRQAIDNPHGEELVPVLSDQLVALKHKTKVYAYSQVADRWDTVTVSAAKGVQPAVGQQSVFVYDGDLLHSFAIGSGRWSSVNMKTGDVTP